MSKCFLQLNKTQEEEENKGPLTYVASPQVIIWTWHYVCSLNKNSLTDLPKLLCQIRHRVRRLRHLSQMGNPFSPEFVADAKRREFMNKRSVESVTSHDGSLLETLSNFTGTAGSS